MVCAKGAEGEGFRLPASQVVILDQRSSER